MSEFRRHCIKNNQQMNNCRYQDSWWDMSKARTDYKSKKDNS